MALRIAREEVYVLVAVTIDHAMLMQGQKNYSLPLTETRISDCDLDELKRIGSKGAASGLLMMDGNIGSLGTPTIEGGFNIAYSVVCGLAMKNGVQHIRLSHIEPINFDLYWKDGKVYQQGNANDCDMEKPTNVQMAFLDKITRNLLLQHGIKTVEVSRANPFLQALLIPLSVGERVVKAFANDLFHALKVLPNDNVMNVGKANHYCALGLDEGSGVYLVIFNHPAIFDYLEDSPEGRCAYGEWKP